MRFSIKNKSINHAQNKNKNKINNKAFNKNNR